MTQDQQVSTDHPRVARVRTFNQARASSASAAFTFSVAPEVELLRGALCNVVGQ